VVIANAWGMLHDPEVYKDPFKFNPDRFLPVSEGGDGNVLLGHFGFGRRYAIHRAEKMTTDSSGG